MALPVEVFIFLIDNSVFFDKYLMMKLRQLVFTFLLSSVVLNLINFFVSFIMFCIIWFLMGGAIRRPPSVSASYFPCCVQ